MCNYLKIAEQDMKRAHEIISETGVLEAWQSIGATVNLVGSLKTELLMNNLDIDFHIYSEEIDVAASFCAIAAIAQNPRIKNVQYVNQMDTDEKCLEWHIDYIDTDERKWKIDMIHILKGSLYDGYFENVADRIAAVLTPETRSAILSIKYDLPDDEKVMGILIYQAVIRDGIRNYDEFKSWKEQNPVDGIIEWVP